MQSSNVRFTLTFLSGVIAATLATALSGGRETNAATRYEDLSLFTHVLSLVRANYVEPVEEHAAHVIGGPTRSRQETVERREMLSSSLAAANLDHTRDAVPARAHDPPREQQDEVLEAGLGEARPELLQDRVE